MSRSSKAWLTIWVSLALSEVALAADFAALVSASSAIAGSQMGFSVAVSQGTLVAGAPMEGPCGAAYVFVRGSLGWEFQARLAPEAGEGIGSLFGRAVSIDGDTVVVGADEDDERGYKTGAAYIFVRGNGQWQREAKLFSSDIENSDHFGYSVCLQGERAVIGAPYEHSKYGAVYVFERSGTVWSQTQKVSAHDGGFEDWYGTSVALDGNTLAVGSPHDDDGGFASGSAYFYVLSGLVWQFQDKVVASDAAAGDNFGNSMALRGDVAVVGSYLDDSQVAADTGAAYVIVRQSGQWAEQQKLVASDRRASDQFAVSVAYGDGTIAVGCYLDDDRGNASGSVYLFVGDGASWVEGDKLTASDGAIGDRLGWSVAMDQGLIAAGAPFANPSGITDAGVVYLTEGSSSNERPTIESVAVSPSAAAVGDLLYVQVVASDDKAVVAVSADGNALTESGGIWQGYIPAKGPAGMHAVLVAAEDEAGLIAFHDLTSYRTLPVVHIGSRALQHPVAISVADRYLFTVWGRAAAVDSDEFVLDEAGGMPVTVLAVGHAVQPGGYWAVRGRLEMDGEAAVIVADPQHIIKLD